MLRVRQYRPQQQLLLKWTMNTGAYTSRAMMQFVAEPSNPGVLIVRHLEAMHKARKRHHMIAYNNKIFVFTGATSSIEIFDVLTESWTVITGFQDTLGRLGRLSGVCSLDPRRVILASSRPKELTDSFLLVNLDKDPVKETGQFIKKLNGNPELDTNINGFATQIWIPTLSVFSGKREAAAAGQAMAAVQAANRY